MTSDPADTEREVRLNSILANYLDTVESGQPEHLDALLERYPDLADQIIVFFREQDQVFGLASPLRSLLQAEWSLDTRASTHEAGGAPDALGVPGQAFGEYELQEVIGEGGMGVVYRAWQKSLRRLVALKMIRAGSLASPEDLRRFRNEAEAAATLDHPNIVPVYEVGECNGQLYFSMKLIEGGSLAKAVNAPMSSKETQQKAAHLLATIARAVHHAHVRGILHRDLKPSNILLDGDGKPYVADFGLAKRVEMDSNLTQSGLLVGTPTYMAPEQTGAASLLQPLSRAVDIYGLGAILYTVLTGLPPFRGSTVLETLELVRLHEPMSPRLLNDRVDRDLESICLKCMEKEPIRRYETAEALARDLERWQQGDSIHARPPSALDRLNKWGRRHRSLVAAGMSILLILVAALGVSTYLIANKHAEVVRQRDEASRQRDLARQQTGEVRRHLYVANMAQAFRAWQVHDHEGLRAFLDSQRPGPDETDLRGFEWNLLERLYRITPRSERTLRGHAGEVYSVTFSPNGAALTSAGMDGKIHFWDPITGVARPQSLEHGVEVNCVAYSPSGQLLATACDQGIVKVWDVASGQLLQEIRHGDKTIECVAFAPNGTVLASAADDFTVKVWSVGSNKLMKTLLHSSPTHSVAFAPNGSSLCTVNDAGLVSLWDAQNYTLRREFSAGKAVLTVQYSHDGRFVAAAGVGGIIRRWDISTGRNLPDLVHGSTVQCVAFSPNDKFLASAGDDAVIRIWDLAAKAERMVLRGHRTRVWCVAYSPDGQWLVSSGHDQTVRLWQPNQFTEKALLSIPANHPRDLGFSTDGQIIATLSQKSGQVEFWDANSVALIGRTPKTLGRAICMASSPTENLLALFKDDGNIQLWNWKTNEPGRLIEGSAASVTGAVFSPDGSCLAAALDKGIAVWNRNTGRRGSFVATASPSCKPAISPDGKLLAGVCDLGTVALWEMSTGSRVATLQSSPPDSISAIAFSPDGTLLAVSFGATVRLWDVAQGIERSTLVCHEGMAGVQLAFTLDGRTLAIGGGTEGKIIFWSVATAQEILGFDSEIVPIKALAFSPDGGALVAAGGWDLDAAHQSKLLIWRAKPGPTEMNSAQSIVTR